MKKLDEVIEQVAQDPMVPATVVMSLKEIAKHIESLYWTYAESDLEANY